MVRFTRTGLCVLMTGLICTTAFGADWDDERAARAFLVLDKDQDRLVSLEEFRPGLQQSHIDNADKVFKRFDADADGQIRHRDLRAQWDVANNYLRKEVYAVEAATQNRVMEWVYRNLDADGDNALSQDEFSKCLRIEDRSRAGELFARIDDNSDARIERGEFFEDWNEFRANMTGEIFYVEANSPAGGEQTAVAFKAIDTNGDAKITIHEYRKALNSSDATRVVESFHRMDQDEDGLVNQAEFQQSWDAVVVLIPPALYGGTTTFGIERQEPGLNPATRVRIDVVSYEAIDANRDGLLTIQEFQTGVVGSREENTKLFYQLDQNFDGYLQYSELTGEIGVRVKPRTSAP